MRKNIHTQDLGTIDYAEAFDLQLKLHSRRIENKIPDTLLLLEHPHVFTLGRHAQEGNVVWNENELEQHHVKVHQVDRGGDVTYHGPGQLVGYPIIKLKDRDLLPRRLVEWVENLIIRTVASYGIASYANPDHPGVWVGDAKICAIGMRIKEGVSYHGFALNVLTDLSYFNGIVPCGIQNKRVCSLSSVLGRKINIEEVKQRLIKEAKSI
ncbi:MAG: lipoyl(octanoyl) transferase LipB [Candidatus Marinimicrobia bacterium]|nr:lipoyl(octanoyl) transferase LipB [Candidatus Neomarinimicrobiota bacterium]